tara:strand:- start:490 stop:759 length:270 start_codon:yes stop_codon:yes gene_type:complete
MQLVNSQDLVTATPQEIVGNDSIISFQAEIPVQIQMAMNKFIENYPNWDQYRLIQAALAGFLMQNGVQSRSITQLYVGNMFSKTSCSQN